MNSFLKKICFLSVAFSALALSSVMAQTRENMGEVYTGTNTTESGNKPIQTPLDGIYERKLHKEKQIIAYDFIHEKDVMWEKRIWREIDVNEKMNHPFKNEKEGQAFISILLKHANDGDIQLYGTGDDEFQVALPPEEQKGIGVSYDTVEVFDPETFEVTYTPVVNKFDPNSVQKFRLKEVWFFDEETSTMSVRILGIAPVMDKTDDNGNFLATVLLFWVYYPDLRVILARHEAFNEHNDAMRMSWEDIFENRHFASRITKESNVYDRRIQDYKAGLDILLEGEKIKDGIFNFEHDMWEY